jgi:chromosome segregation ATPase
MSKIVDEMIRQIVDEHSKNYSSQEISTQTDPCVDVIDRLSEEFDTNISRVQEQSDHRLQIIAGQDDMIRENQSGYHLELEELREKVEEGENSILHLESDVEVLEEKIEEKDEEIERLKNIINTINEMMAPPLILLKHVSEFSAGE